MNKVAIIGVQCRFPDHSKTIDEFFDNLQQARNYCRETPADRWDLEKYTNPQDAPGKAYVRHGHYLDYDYKSFDAQAFGFAPKEVEFIDPQQRLLLETVWEALENAHIPSQKLAGSDTGVYIGGFTTDHMLNQFASGNRYGIGSHSAAGATLTMLANRVSYAFDLNGPSVSMDTACSSSLVAFVMAVQDIQSGRCPMAIAGGVNFMLRPEYVIAMCKGNFLAPDGRSKSFDASANGYGRGEGCGILILKDAKQAQQDGDDILAYVDGAGINQDGRTSGITVPNPAAQEALMRSVLSTYDIDPASVQYVEAHGTGTPVGDPKEAAAIGNMYGIKERPSPCVIGSVKSNIGHLEAAAGAAGLIKAVAMLKHKSIPPIAGLKKPNPALPLEEKNIALAQTSQALDDSRGAIRIAINSFGYGGTNAHVVLSSANSHQQKVQSKTSKENSFLLPLSAKSESALKEHAQQLANTLTNHSLNDCGFSLSRYRNHYECRAAIFGTEAEIKNQLAEFQQATDNSNIISGRAKTHAKTAWIYTGMGPQWWGMGRGLWQNNVIYRQALQKADELFKKISGFSILEEMLKDETSNRIQKTELAQPANFLVQYGLSEIFKHHGMTPQAVVGHSVGEVASAWASGMLSLEDALTVSYHRSRLQATTAGQGGMLAVGASEESIQPYLNEHIEIAAINAPASLTLAGDAEQLNQLAAVLEAEGVFNRALQVEVPYHSRYMDSIKADIISTLEGLDPMLPHTNLYSTVTGKKMHQAFFDNHYWVSNVRQPVYFMEAIKNLLADGYTHFVEIGPHPVLSRSIKDIFKALNSDAQLASSLSMKEDDVHALGNCLAQYYVQGGVIDWSQHFKGGHKIHLPNYPWDREILWRESDSQMKSRTQTGSRSLASENPGRHHYCADLTTESLNFLDDHKVAGERILPAAAFLDCMFAVAEQAMISNNGQWALTDIRIDKALVIERDSAPVLNANYHADEPFIQLHSTNANTTEAQIHSSAKLRPVNAKTQNQLDIGATIKSMPECLNVNLAYQRFAEMQLDYGESFQTINALYRDKDAQRVIAKLELPLDLYTHKQRFIAHPALVDGAFQCALALLNEEDSAYLPTGIEEFRLKAALPEICWVDVNLVEKTPKTIRCNLRFYSEEGKEVADILGLKCSALNPPSQENPLPDSDYTVAWLPSDIDLTRISNSNKPIIIIADNTAGKSDAFVQNIAACADADSTPCRVCFWQDDDLAEVLHTSIQTIPDLTLALCFSSGLENNFDIYGEQALNALLQSLRNLAALTENSPSIRVITRNAIACEEDAINLNPAQSAIFNFTRVAYNELEHLNLSSIDVDAEFWNAENILKSFQIDEQELALRNNSVYLPSLKPTGIFSEIPEVNSTLDDQVCWSFKDGRIKECYTPKPAHNEARIDFKQLYYLPESASFTKRRSMGFYGTLSAINSDSSDLQVGEDIFGTLPEQHCTSACVSLNDINSQSINRASHTHNNAALPLLIAPVIKIAEQMNLPGSSSIAICESAHGQILAQLLEAEGHTVTRLPASSAEWQEDPLQEKCFDAIAAPLGLWSQHFGFSRWLKNEGILVDLELGENQTLALPGHCSSLLRLKTACQALLQSSNYELADRKKIDSLKIPSITLGDNFQVDRLEAGALVNIEARTKTKALKNIQTRFKADASYLITGGFGALGKQTALWLAENGAGRIVLCSRKGANTPGASAFTAQLEALGAQTQVEALDTADTHALKTLIKNTLKGQKPLKGIFHTAGVLEDKSILDLQDADIKKVLRPKACGALAMHEATEQAELDHFVMFSSIATIVGNKKQANYCAANGFMDALAQKRKAAGLPALSVNLGAIGEVGMAADKNVEAHLKQIGLTPLSPKRALAGIGFALQNNHPQLVISAAPNWERYTRYDTRGSRSTRLREVCGPFLDKDDSSKLASLTQFLKNAEFNDRVNGLNTLLLELIAVEMKIDAASFSANQSLDSIGIDSLIAADIQYRIEESIGINISTMLLIGESNIEKITQRILSQLGLWDHD